MPSNDVIHDVDDTDYELLDFGAGRKLERFGRYVLDRCSPAAEASEPRNHHWLWDVKLDEKGGIVAGRLDEHPWLMELCGIKFQLKLTPFGHVGLFPEQQTNWDWLRSQVRMDGQSRQALNLFAYTGGATMALALAGYHVVHVDASEPAVRWARDNAALNELSQHPIRWIVEDARKFAHRELKRGRRYEIIVLDPPTFGHGPKGARWEIEDHLHPLLEVVTQLLATNSAALLLTAHAYTPDLPTVQEWLEELLPSNSSRWAAATLTAARLALRDPSGRRLDSGYSVRWQCVPEIKTSE